VNPCPLHTCGPRHGAQCRRMGQGRVSNAHGWAGGRLSQAYTGLLVLPSVSIVHHPQVYWYYHLSPLYTIHRPTHFHCEPLTYSTDCMPFTGPPSSIGQPSTGLPISIAHPSPQDNHPPATGPPVCTPHHDPPAHPLTVHPSLCTIHQPIW